MSKGSRNRTTDRIVVRREDEEEVRKALVSAPDGPLMPIVFSDAVPDDMAVMVKDGQVLGVLRCSETAKEIHGGDSDGLRAMRGETDETS